MKHLRRYNESKSRLLTEDIINECFAYAFDLVEKKEIYEIYTDTERSGPEKGKEGLYDFFANIGRQEKYIEGYQINFETSFYSSSSVEDFRKYIQLLNEIDEGIDKLKEVYKVDIIQFDDVSNSIICLQVAYNDIKLVSDL